MTKWLASEPAQLRMQRISLQVSPQIAPGLLRGIVLAAAMVLVRLLQGILLSFYPTTATVISIVLVALFGCATFSWGMFDGHHEINESGQNHHRDAAVTWLCAGLIAGILSGIVAWLVSLTYHNIYVQKLVSEITTVAAFTALLVFVPAIVAVALGRALARHQHSAAPHSDTVADTISNTDVFDAVHQEDSTNTDDTNPDPDTSEIDTSKIDTSETEALTEPDEAPDPKPH